MSVRLQTWAPYEIQVALNGREWLRRSLDKAGCGYVLCGNKFLHIDDCGLAQGMLDAQPGTLFDDVLDGFLPTVFPEMPQVLGKGLSYYWTFWQTEVARDYIFGDSGDLSGLMDDFMIHAMVSGKGERILKYFGKPIRAGGQPHQSAKPEIVSRAKSWYDGARIRHWNGTNSVKLYNEHNVLRFEVTMNDPGMFKIHRHAENQDKSEEKRFMPMRKGISDAAARVEISRQVISRFAEHMAAVEQTDRLGEVLSSVTSPIFDQGKRARALDVFGKDRDLLLAIADPAFDVHAITNKKLQKTLGSKGWAKSMTGKRLSGRITRHLRLLREHGLIKKLPNQRKYALTDKGRRLTAAIESASAASVNDLLKLAA
jgi:predicted transcriptional regulator